MTTRATTSMVLSSLYPVIHVCQGRRHEHLHSLRKDSGIFSSDLYNCIRTHPARDRNQVQSIVFRDVNLSKTETRCLKTTDAPSSIKVF